ncbi:O-methyltransferase [Sporosarcina sp. Te-1]|uniref:O-methyltransferase n=1 Tax=Sporosarcina sp. Te-1 TaxID=2818390 RepID=UPI001A9FB79A|nr:O-methyltransferase [Sporosarcina sp. Te-1]QTD41626.1 O-methyltransferase [Sporosarcina sp. Te-1]
MSDYNQYIADLNESEDPLISEMESVAREQHVPIMDRSGIDTFIGLLRIQRPSAILEIGSAIGYSAIRMAMALRGAAVTTIERDIDRYEMAVDFIRRSSVSDYIDIIEGDALLMDDEKLPFKEYDALFIDAAKGQYKRFFEKYEAFVKPGGIIYCDNMFMHGAVLTPDEELPKRNRTMIRNLKEFNKWIMAHPNYETTLLPVGDGILIAIKK